MCERFTGGSEQGRQVKTIFSTLWGFTEFTARLTWGRRREENLCKANWALLSFTEVAPEGWWKDRSYRDIWKDPELEAEWTKREVPRRSERLAPRSSGRDSATAQRAGTVSIVPKSGVEFHQRSHS